jgi:hypothetical protein
MIGGESGKGMAHRYIAGVLSHRMYGSGMPLFMAAVVLAKFIDEAVKLLPPSGQ